MSEPARQPDRSLAGSQLDQQRLDAWRAGDRDALEALLRSYQGRVYHVCYRMLGSPDDAADLAQDALAKVLDGLHTFDGRSQLSTWIIRVAMNCCLSHLRKQRLRRHGSLSDPSAAADRAMRTEPTAEPGVEQTERSAAVGRALRRLDPQSRSVILLRDLQDLDYQQIATVLGVPVGTVKSRLFRARVSLRELVAQEWPDHPGSEVNTVDETGNDESNTTR